MSNYIYLLSNCWTSLAMRDEDPSLFYLLMKWRCHSLCLRVSVYLSRLSNTLSIIINTLKCCNTNFVYTQNLVQWARKGINNYSGTKNSRNSRCIRFSISVLSALNAIVIFSWLSSICSVISSSIFLVVKKGGFWLKITENWGLRIETWGLRIEWHTKNKKTRKLRIEDWELRIEWLT